MRRLGLFPTRFLFRWRCRRAFGKAACLHFELMGLVCSSYGVAHRCFVSFWVGRV